MNKNEIISDLSKAIEQLKDKPIEGSLVGLYQTNELFLY